MAVSLVIAERTMATSGLRFSGGSHASRKARTIVAPMLGDVVLPSTRSSTIAGSTGISSAAPNSSSLEPK